MENYSPFASSFLQFGNKIIATQNHLTLSNRFFNLSQVFGVRLMWGSCQSLRLKT